jgi:hypothetical protein
MKPSISRLPLQTLDTAPPAARIILTEIVEKSGGRLFNFQTAMANSAVTLAAYWGIRRAVEEHASLEPRIRTAVQLAVSGVDQAQYSTGINTMLTRRVGWTAEEVHNILNGLPVGDAKLDALLALAREATAAAGRVADLTWQEALDNGWTAEELTEAFTCVLLTELVDQFVNYGQITYDVVG